MLTVLKTLVVVVMVLLLIGLPFGLPSLWIVLGILLGSAVFGWIPWSLWWILAGVTVVAELLEFVILQRMSARYGGTRSAFAGAVLGGLIGVFVGFPVPVAGPVIAAFIGTFLGAGLATLLQRRSLKDAAKVGWGVMLARVLAIGLKVGVGVAVVVVGGGAILLPEQPVVEFW